MIFSKKRNRAGIFTMEKNTQANAKNPFAIMEEEVLEFWKNAETFEKSVKKEAPKGDYVFYDGPPFITGLPHYATLLPSIAKDMVPRYYTMKGYRVERVWGWDCHGLPAENKVEKELGLKNKLDIEALGVEKFVGACRKYVETASEQWEYYINRIARWVDMKNAYKTMDLRYMESVMWAFKNLYDQCLIYEGYRSSLHCPRCATPLSKFELTMDAGSYRDVKDTSAVVKFRLKTLPDMPEFTGKEIDLLAWTTTPWTLVGNLSLAVGKGLAYVLAGIKSGKGETEYYIVAKERAEEILSDQNPAIIREFQGKELVGLEYEPLFDLGNEKLNRNENAFRIYNGDFVTVEEGTGIVHIAPNFGEDDFNLGQAEGLPIIDLMNEMGVYTEEAGEWQGLYFKKAGTKVMETLQDKLFMQFEYKHSYPFCYRCDTPLIYKTQKAWYLRIDDIRSKMIKNNKQINWVPEHFGEGRFRNNIETAPDWCLSRSRYWGSPIPVWRCEGCSEIKVPGSIDELEKLSGQPVTDLHRPQIDGHEFRCDKCGGRMLRVKEVLDCWFESGSMPFAQFHYPFEREKDWKNLFPADFIIEYTGQLRGWFYVLHVLSTALFGEEAFKNVIVSGVLAGTDGRKMSKSFGNYPDPRLTLDKYGADALRMYFMSSSIMLGDDAVMNEKDVQDALRKNVMLLWNVVKFYEMFAADYRTEEGLSPSSSEEMPELRHILDKWIISRLHQLITEVTEGLEKYDLPRSARAIQPFIEDLSTWYLRRSRDRFKSEDAAERREAIEVMRHVLLCLSKVIAPLMPFIAEQVWQKVSAYGFLNKEKSVHLEDWIEPGKIDRQILEEMEATRKIVELALARRDEAGIKVRQPLSRIIVRAPKNVSIKNAYIELIKDEVNVKDVEFKGNGVEIKVDLDTSLTEDLILEGMKRELVRSINNLRKDMGFTISDRIAIYWEGGEKIRQVIKRFRAGLLRDTLAEEIKEGIGDDASMQKPVDINGEEVILGVSLRN